MAFGTLFYIGDGFTKPRDATGIRTSRPCIRKPWTYEALERAVSDNARTTRNNEIRVTECRMIRDARNPSSALHHNVRWFIQPMLVYAPPSSSKKRPLLIGLHTWTFGCSHTKSVPYGRWSIARGWYFLHPYFRGPNTNACDLAVQDVLDAVNHMSDRYKSTRRFSIPRGIVGRGWGRMDAIVFVLQRRGEDGDGVYNDDGGDVLRTPCSSSSSYGKQKCGPPEEE